MIPINRPSIRRKDMDSVLTCMVNDSLGPGEQGRELVRAVADIIGIAGGVAVRDNQRAIRLALELIELPPGARIAIDALAPSYYDDAIRRSGFEPVYVDVKQGGVCIDPAGIEAVQPSTVICRTTLGFVPDLRTIAAIGIPIIEDISEGLGANTGDERVGTFGQAVIVGLEPDGVITAGGGSIVLASSRGGSSVLAEAAEPGGSVALLPDMNAALGLTQVRELERFIARRAELASLFGRAIMRGRHTAPSQDGDAENVHFAFPVLVEGAAPEVRLYARKKGVETDLAFADSVLATHGTAAEDPEGAEMTTNICPNARSVMLRCIRFPLYPALTSREATTIERVLSSLP